MSKVRTLLFSIVTVLAVSFTAVNAQEQTIVEIAAGDPQFSTLVELVTAAGLAETLSGEGPFTVFAPTNDAFAALPEEVVAYIVANPELLTSILTYHVVPGAILSTDLSTMMAATVEGDEISVEVSDAGVKIDGVNVTTADIVASNGVVHIIDGVLLPEIELPEVDALAVEGDILVAGSSTVLPVSERMADLFVEDGFAGSISVEGGGTGAGFEKFCTNLETDIADASRAIKDAEAEACVAGGRPAIGFQVGTDALAVVVSRENTFVESLNLETLAGIYNGAFTKWNEVNAEWPAEPIVLVSPGSDSGTFDFFVEVVLDKNEEGILGNPGITLSEDDNTLVAAVEASQYAIGYFGSAYYFENIDRLRAIGVEGVEPTQLTAESGTYPLSRPLFIYSSPAVIAEKPQVGEFINYYLTNVSANLGTEEGQIGYFPASARSLRLDALELLAAMGMGGM